MSCSFGGTTFVDKIYHKPGYLVLAPTPEELKAAAHAHIAEFRKELMSPEGTRLMNANEKFVLFQPTSKYQYQASEMCWAKVKGFAGKNYMWGRNQDDLVQQATMGFYGAYF